MSVMTDAGNDAITTLKGALEEVEEEISERIANAVDMLTRYAPVPPVDDSAEATMDDQTHGDWLDREEVFAAIRRGWR